MSEDVCKCLLACVGASVTGANKCNRELKLRYAAVRKDSKILAGCHRKSWFLFHDVCVSFGQTDYSVQTLLSKTKGLKG